MGSSSEHERNEDKGQKELSNILSAKILDSKHPS